MVDFIVLGLPRSGTTWLSAWLDCEHDPFARLLPEQVHGGIVCTGAYLMPGWLVQQDCPVAVIERDPADCDASLARMGLLATTAHMRRMLAKVEGRRFRYADLWNEDTAADLWAYLKRTPFDAARYRRLKEIRMEPRTTGWDARVAEELIRRGLLVMED